MELRENQKNQGTEENEKELERGGGGGERVERE